MLLQNPSFSSTRLVASVPLFPARNAPHKCSPSLRRLRCQQHKNSAEASDPLDAINDILEDANALMAEVGVRRENQEPEKKVPISNPEQPRMTLHCDVNGCTIAPVIDDPVAFNGRLGGRFDVDEDETIEEDLLTMEGDGWKLGYDQNPTPDNIFHGFVGGDNWTIYLTKDEYYDFIKLLKNLQQSVATLEICGEWDKEGSAEATLEMSTPRIWMQGRAAQHQLSLLQRIWSSRSPEQEKTPSSAFSLRFLVISAGNRGFEGYWPDRVVMAVLKSLNETTRQDSDLVNKTEGELVYETD